MHTEHENRVADSDPDWPLAATRWAQITLAEDDPAHFDADFWLRLMRDSKANATCISAGGYVAYYPTATRVPLPQQVPRRHRPVRNARRRRSQPRHERDGAGRPARDPRRRRRSAPRMAGPRPGRQPDRALGVPGYLADVRVHAVPPGLRHRGDSRDRPRVRRRRGLRQSVGGVRRDLVQRRRPQVVPGRDRSGVAGRGTRRGLAGVRRLAAPAARRPGRRLGPSGPRPPPARPLRAEHGGARGA